MFIAYFFMCSVVSGLCDELITRSEEKERERVCVCVSSFVWSRNINKKAT